jgi:ubiquinone/menaquinone biosynthesis C-methylase UbiE
MATGKIIVEMTANESTLVAQVLEQITAEQMAQMTINCGYDSGAKSLQRIARSISRSFPRTVVMDQ